MKKNLLILTFLLITNYLFAQNKLTLDALWKLGRVGVECVCPNGNIIYGVSVPNVDENKSKRSIFIYNAQLQNISAIEIGEGNINSIKCISNNKFILLQKGVWKVWNSDDKTVQEIKGLPENADNVRVSPSSSHILYTMDTKLEKFKASDKYTDLPKSNVYIYTSLNQRHWDTWADGTYSHVYVAQLTDNVISNSVDIMADKPYDCPQKPHGGAEDVIWSNNGKAIYYVTKPVSGTQYAISTNTDIFKYDLETKQTTNITNNMKGYDMMPILSPDGNYLAWLSMAREGYEADKNDIIIMQLSNGNKQNITANWDGTVNSFVWKNANQIYFNAYTKGTEQIFSISNLNSPESMTQPTIVQNTDGAFNVSNLCGWSGDNLIITRQDFNHADEIYSYNTATSMLSAITHVNDTYYNSIKLSKVEQKWITTTDGKKMLVYVIFPPDFDANKKYPTLLYCQGGPQSALSQFYSYRWNFQLMAANGYIVVAPNRRGMPGHGVKWNEQISGDWGGQSIQDYLTAIDSVSEMPYVDKSRRAAVGASYGGYSVYMLAGVSKDRFKSFIAHDGVYDLRSWYGTTEEIWFSNWDMGGPYWDSKNDKTFTQFNPISYINNWKSPILIYQGGKDFRTPIEQGLQAFQAAQLKGIKSKLVYLPDENHWVLSAQNAQVWQREFYSWLSETLK